MVLSKFLIESRKETTFQSLSSLIAEPSFSMDSFLTIAGRSTLAMCDLASAVRHIVNIATPIDESQGDEEFLRVQRISLAIAGVCNSFNLTGVIIFVFEIATELGYTISSLFKSLVEMFKELPHVSTQLIQTLGGILTKFYTGFRGSDVIDRAEPSMDMGELFSKMSEPDVISTLCTVIGGLAALIAASLVGRSSFKPNRSFLENISNFGQQISKLKNGIYSLISLVVDFANLVKEATLSYFGQTIHRSVVAAVESLRIPFKDGYLDAATFFELIATLNTQEGEQEMSVNKDALVQGKMILMIISKLTTKTMQEQMQISSTTIMHLRQISRELESRVRVASVKTQTESSRFTPFSIWLFGEPGVGKSVAMNLLCSTLLADLEREDAVKYEIPRKEQQIFSCTFSQEFHTGYNDHYLVKFDDMCQDKPGSNRTSSTLQFIQWVSCVPVNVNQAALEDKKCPFSSKVMVCTSNEGWPNRDKEIQDNVAFLRRRNILVECVRSKRNDDVLNHPIAFRRRDPIDESEPGKIYKSFKELMREVCVEYRRHFEAQQLLNNVQGEDLAQRLVEELNQAEPSLQGDVFSLDGPSSVDEHNRLLAEGYYHLNGLGLGMVRFSWLNGRYEAVPYVLEIPGTFVVSQSRLEEILNDVCPDPENCVEYTDEAKMCFVWESEQFDIAQPSMLSDVVKKFVSRKKETTFEFLENCYAAALEYKTWFKSICVQKKWLIVAAIGSAAIALTGFLSQQTYKRYKRFAEPSYDKKLIRIKPKPQMPTQGQLVAKPSMDVFAHTLLEKNLVVVERDGKRLNGFFIKDRWLVTCQHVFDLTESHDGSFTVYVKGCPIRQIYDEKRRFDVEGTEDICIYLCDMAVPQFRDIIHNFAKGGDVMPEHFNGTLVSRIPIIATRTLPFDIQKTPISKWDGGQFVRYFRGEGLSEKGVSGSPLIVSESTGRSPTILGVEVAVLSAYNSCLVEPLTKEMLLATIGRAEPSMLELYSCDEEDEFFDCSDNYQEFWEAVKQNVHFVGRTEKLHMSTKTSLRPSLIAQTFEKDETLKLFAPAALSGRSEGVSPEYQCKDPMLLSMKGFGIPLGAFDCRVGDVVLSAFIEEDKMIRQSPKLKMRLLTNAEILDGIPGFLKGIELSTSPGLPYVKERVSEGKKDFISFDGENRRVASTRVWKDVQELEIVAMNGEIANLTAYACLKDELRPIERVACCKTRTFIVLPMHYNLLLRKYFGTWIAVQHLRAGFISSCVGIDPNTQWNILYDRLTAIGEDMEDFDYSDWDRTLHGEWFRIYADRVSASYGDKPGSVGFNIRRSLMSYLVHMNVQIRDFIVQTHCGNKSGCAITAEINSDVHDMLMYYVWLRICKKLDYVNYMTLAQFRENCAMVVYGDDIIKSTAPGIIDWFNGQNIRTEVQELGMNITPANKTETEFKAKSISEVTFLKRSFVKIKEDKGLVRGPLDKAVLQRMVLWVHKSDDCVLATKANIEGALRESFYWGELFYKELKRKCFDAWGARFAGVGYPPLLDVPSYEVMEQCFREKRADWAPVLFQSCPLSVIVESEDIRF